MWNKGWESPEFKDAPFKYVKETGNIMHFLPLLLLLSQNPRGSVEDERGSSSRLPDAEGHVCWTEGR